MTVPDVYTLVTLLGFYLSEASRGHQKAYKELLAQVDDGHTLTLDKVQITIIRSSRSRTPRAFSLRIKFFLRLVSTILRTTTLDMLSLRLPPSFPCVTRTPPATIAFSNGSYLSDSSFSPFLCPVCWERTRTFLQRAFRVEGCFFCVCTTGG